MRPEPEVTPRREAIKASKSERKHVSIAHQEAAMAALLLELQRRLTQYGAGTYASRHEVLGILQEEMFELTAAVHAAPLRAPVCDADFAAMSAKFRRTWMNSEDTVRAELLDVAVAAVFSVACIDAGTLAW